MITHDDSKILKEIAECLPYAAQRNTIRNLVQIPDRLSEFRDIWAFVREDLDAATSAARVFHSAITHRYTDGDREEAIDKAVRALTLDVEPITDLPKKIRGVLNTIEVHSCHINRPRPVEDLILVLRDSLQIVETVIEKANL